MTNTEQQLLALLAASLFGSTLPESMTAPDYLPSEELLAEATAQAVLPLAYAALPESKRGGHWRAAFMAHVSQNIRLQYEHARAHELLSSHDIPYVILKGCASGSYYPDPVLRRYGDVDFLVGEKDFDRAASVLKEAGFKAAEEDDGDTKHVAYHQSGCVWELHRRVNGIPKDAMGDPARRLFADVIDTARTVSVGQGCCVVPDDVHHGLIILLHTADHITSEGIGLRHLCDWAVFADHFTDNEFRTAFEELFRTSGLWRFAQLLTVTSSAYLGLPRKAWADEVLPLIGADVPARIMADILGGGNFGAKDKDRSNQIKYVKNRDTKAAKGGVIRQAWSNVKTKAAQQGKSKAAVMWDFVGKVARGERKSDSAGTLRAASRRRALYREFRLFDDE